MTAARSPRVSVVMAVRNGQGLVGDAVRSILDQTFSDFQFVIVDDCSTDDTVGEIEQFSDDRIVLLRLDRPSGDLAMALDAGVRNSTGRFLARMDADDISYPSRLERQIAVLEERTDVVMVGSWVDTTDADGNHRMVSRPPCEAAAVRFVMHYRCPFHHPSMMLRRSTLEAAGGYRSGYRYCEDYDLWRRMILLGDAINMPEVLLAQRYYPQSTSGLNAAAQAALTYQIGVEMVRGVLGRPVATDTAAALNTQQGSDDALLGAGRTLVDLHRAFAGNPGFEDDRALATTVASELTCLARHASSPKAAAALWARALQAQPMTTVRIARDIGRGRLSDWRHGWRPDRLRGTLTGTDAGRL